MEAAPSLTPDACRRLPIGEAFGLLAGRARLMRRARRNAEASQAAPGGGSDGSYTDANGFRHTRITSMDQLYGMFPRKG